MKKKQLKNRILINIFMALTISMVASTIIGYLYFENIVRKQKISDETGKLQQVSNQIDFMVEDIESFANSIIVDNQIQDALEKQVFENSFQRVKYMDEIAKRLVFYNSLRTYIGCSFLEQKDGERYSSGNSRDADYLIRKFEGDIITRFKEQTEYAFSEPYVGLDTGNIQQVVCYRREIWDKYSYGEKQGDLYLEINLDYFLKQIRLYGKDYDNVCLIGNDQMILYEQDPESKMKALMTAEAQPGHAGVFKVEGGYLICEEVASTNWKLCTLITNQYLWERSSFVLGFFTLSFLLSLAMILLTTSRILENKIRPITNLAVQMEHINYEKMSMREMAETGDEIQTLYECFENMLVEIRRGMEAQIEYERQKKEMEFDIMLSQINPHYLYNVLNTVVYLAAAENNKKIVKIVNSLIYTLQETLNMGGHSIDTTINKELELTGCYLNIQEYRYPDAFKIIVDCPEELNDYLVPKTIIQPLVENAILHGILPSEEAGTIRIGISLKENRLLISVEDDGIGIRDEVADQFRNGESLAYQENGRKHIGICNIRDRIKYLYGSPYGMEIERISIGGTRVILFLPAIKQAESME